MPSHTPQPTWRTVLIWYYGKRPAAILKGSAAYLSTCAEIFSFIFLLKTLLSPWKAIRDTGSKRRGLSLLAESVVFNATSRGAGCVVRLITLVFGLIGECAIAAICLGYFLLWITFPVLLLWGILVLLGLA